MPATAIASAHSQCCSECGHDMPVDRMNCPHCARPLIFPNVTSARSRPEEEKLAQRHNQALELAKSRACESIARDFQEACKATVAVFGCALERLLRETSTGTDLYETYYDLEHLRLQSGGSGELNWSVLRPQAEIQLFGTHKHIDQIHYACLSLDGSGLNSYGDCQVCLSESMISHRATCFEGNTAVVFHQNHDFDSHARSEWADRHQICLTACANRLSPVTTVADFPSVLLEVGAKRVQDHFIEVHVFGPMTARTFDRVHMIVENDTPRKAVYRDAIKEKLQSFGLEVTTT